MKTPKMEFFRWNKRSILILCILLFAPKAPLFQRPKVSNGSCLSAHHSQILVIFAGTDCTGFTPFSRSCHFNLDFRESLKMTKQLANRTPFWDPFLSLFSEKVPFFPRRPGEGPASRFRSYHRRLRATLPGGSI